MQATIKRADITRMALYIGNCRKTVAQIKRETGADYIINAGFYNMSNRKPIMDLVVNGEALSSARMYYGLGWNTNDVKFYASHEGHNQKFFVGAYPMILNGVNQSLGHTPSAYSRRGRTACGVTSSGDLVLYCVKDGSKQALTSNNLRNAMRNLGCVDAVMYDGGGSSCCDFLGERVTTTRKVHNYILIWVKKRNLYPIPTRTLYRGTAGSQVKWLQYQLNITGAGLEVDGKFGRKTDTAVRNYQRSNNLEVDGRVGPATRNRLKQEVEYG